MLLNLVDIFCDVFWDIIIKKFVSIIDFTKFTINFLDYIENHAVFIGIITAVLSSCFFVRKYIKEKRAEAFFDFYTILWLRLKNLKEYLNEYKQLDFSNNKGNIFSLLYIEDKILVFCPGYKELNRDEQCVVVESAIELKKCILESNCNVYPKRAIKKKWYESQHIILSFCNFLEKEELKHIYSDMNRTDKVTVK